MLGWRLAWAFSAPLLYLFFLVPFGAFLTAALQHFTAGFTDVGLDVLGIPYVMDQFTIEIPEGTFYVAEACAGLRFLIASIAFGVLYACLIYRSPWRRAAFILASCVVPIIANGFRALGIVVLGHVLGSAEAAAADHMLYGWVFFSSVILLLILAGLPFRQDGNLAAGAREAGRDGDAAGGRAPWLAAGLVAAVMAAGPAMAVAIDRAGAAPAAVALPGFARGARLHRVRPGRPARRAAFHLRRLPADRDGAGVSAARQPRHADRRAARRRGGGVRGDVVTGPLAGAPGWRLAEAEKPDRFTATALWIDGDAGLGGLEGRVRQARNSLLGGGLAPVLMAVRIDGANAAMGAAMGRGERRRARAAIAGFIAAQGDLQAVAIGLARAAAAAQ